MKTFIYDKFYLLVWTMMVMLSGCDHFEDMNQNPATSTDMDPNLMLPTLQLQLTGERYETWRNGFIYASDWMQLWTGEYATVEYGGKGQKNLTYMSALWDRQFSREVRNVVDMVERTTDDPGRVNINAVSRIMKVYIFSRLTDLYGDIPYFDAGKSYYTGTLQPAYDRQEDIYNDFFLELNAATTALDAAGDAVTEDIYFDGDISKWRKFGNSLRLRLAMRLTKVNPEKAKAEAEAAIAGGVMESNEDMAVMQHINVAFGGGGLGGNGVAYTFMNASNVESAFRICSTLADHLIATSDPRLELLTGCYLDNSARTEITDQVYGYYGSYEGLAVPPSTFTYEVAGEAITIDVDGEATDVAIGLQLLQPARYLCTFNAPAVVMSYAEVELWMAEAAFRGWNTGSTAAEHYARALVAGIDQFTIYEGAEEVSQGTVDAFVAANPLGVGAELEDINTQLWVNFALNGQEAFANWRRSGYPQLVYPNVAPGVNQTNGEIPRRMQYPTTEYLYNAENLGAAVDRLDEGDDWTGRVWWDVQ